MARRSASGGRAAANVFSLPFFLISGPPQRSYDLVYSVIRFGKWEMGWRFEEQIGRPVGAGFKPARFGRHRSRDVARQTQDSVDAGHWTWMLERKGGFETRPYM